MATESPRRETLRPGNCQGLARALESHSGSGTPLAQDELNRRRQRGSDIARILLTRVVSFLAKSEPGDTLRFAESIRIAISSCKDRPEIGTWHTYSELLDITVPRSLIRETRALSYLLPAIKPSHGDHGVAGQDESGLAALRDAVDKHLATCMRILQWEIMPRSLVPEASRKSFVYKADATQNVPRMISEELHLHLASEPGRGAVRNPELRAASNESKRFQIAC